MNSNTRKTYTAILSAPAPRDLAWTKFENLWSDIADKVENESGDRLAVDYHGHREVFRRQHDGRVGIEDIERARHLLKSTPDLKGHGEVAAVVIDAKQARILVFDLDHTKTVDDEHTVRDSDPRARHLRTVERQTGRDDEHDLTHFFDELAKVIVVDIPDQPFVIFGHGDGKSDVAAEFLERLRSHHAEIGERAVGTDRIDISAANDSDIEAATVRALHGSVKAD